MNKVFHKLFVNFPAVLVAIDFVHPIALEYLVFFNYLCKSGLSPTSFVCRVFDWDRIGSKALGQAMLAVWTKTIGRLMAAPLLGNDSKRSVPLGHLDPFLSILIRFIPIRSDW